MKLTLRKFEARDIAELFRWFETERDVLQWAGANMSWPLKRSEMKALIRQHSGTAPAREVWAVNDSEAMVGHFQLGLNRRLRTAGLGRIAIDPALRGQGLGSTLMKHILAQAFSHAWVHRVDLMVYDHNHSAIAAYKRAGFTSEGTRRETTPISDEIWDTHMMSILRPEYEVFDKRT